MQIIVFPMLSTAHSSSTESVTAKRSTAGVSPVSRFTVNALNQYSVIDGTSHSFDAASVQMVSSQMIARSSLFEAVRTV